VVPGQWLLRAGSRPEEVERLRAELARKELELAQARDPETERDRLKSVVERRSAELSYAFFAVMAIPV
jgi:hypothetical protein